MHEGLLDCTDGVICATVNTDSKPVAYLFDLGVPAGSKYNREIEPQLLTV